MRRDEFRPSRDGFRFPNDFSGHGERWGLGAPVARAFGLAPGMAWAALDRYLADRDAPTEKEAPGPDAALYAQLVQRQANALAAVRWDRIIESQCMPERALPGQPSLATLTRAHWRRAKQQLDAGVPVLLVLIVARGRHANPSLNRAVLATGYDADGAERRVTVRVYDPDRPGDDAVRLTFRTGRFDALEAKFGADARVRGFLAVPYDRPLPITPAFGLARLADRSVDAVLAVHGADRPDGWLEILARDGAGDLVHLGRDRKGIWSADLPDVEGTLGASPATLAGRGRIVARGLDGHLVELRRSAVSGWRASRITRKKEAPGVLPTDGAPAALFSRDTSLVAACQAGTLTCYRRRAVRGWASERIDLEGERARFLGTPVIVEHNGTHVLCRTDGGDLVHARREAKTGWTAASALRRGGRTRFVLDEDPIALVDDGRTCMHVIARTKDGNVVHLRWAEEDGWRPTDLSATLRSAGADIPPVESRLSAALDDAGTIHVVGRTREGDIVHIWYGTGGASGGDRITRDRPLLAGIGAIDGAPVIGTAKAGVLHVLARQGTDLLLFRWTPVGDWSAENITRERGETAPEIFGEPVCSTADDTLHVAFLSAGGTVRCTSLAGRRTRATAPGAAAGDRIQPRAPRRRRPERVGATTTPDPEPAQPAPIAPSKTAAPPKAAAPARPVEAPRPAAPAMAVESPKATPLIRPVEATVAPAAPEPVELPPPTPVPARAAEPDPEPGLLSLPETMSFAPAPAPPPPPPPVETPVAPTVLEPAPVGVDRPATAMPVLPGTRRSPAKEERLVTVKPRGPRETPPAAKQIGAPKKLKDVGAARSSAAVDGLPMLADDEPAGSPKPVPAPEPPTVEKRPKSAAQNLREMERIMTLAEEDRPQVVHPG